MQSFSRQKRNLSVAGALEVAVVQLFEEGMSSDDLLKMSNMVEEGD